MKTIEYNTVDKSDWKYGQGEPDKKQWQHENGLACLMVRNHVGAWCGYVGVPENHPYYEKHYDSVDVDAHGGLTFSDFCQEEKDKSKGVCHDSDEKVWWLGFDCAHYGDISPSIEAMRGNILPFESSFFENLDTYKDCEYVTNEVNNLAVQLKAVV